MHKITWASLKGLHRAFLYVKFWKSVFPTMFKYRGDIAKTGDKSSLGCFFQSNTDTTVVKVSKWKLINMNFIKSKCAWHLFYEVWHGGYALFFEIVKIRTKKVSSTVKSYLCFCFWKSDKATRKLINWWFDSLYCKKTFHV